MTVPTSWSLSKYGQFTKCRRKFLYSYIQRLPQTKGAAASRGVDQHALIEEYFKGSGTLPSDLQHYQAWFDVLRSMEFIAEHKLALLKNWVPTFWEDPNVWWKGVLDLTVLKAPRAWVFDWKTGKIYPDHEDQKELYAIALFTHYPDVHEIEATHVYLDLGKNTTETYTREPLKAPRSDRKVTHLAGLITKWNGKLVPYTQALELYNPETAEMFFVANPTYLCNYCDYSKQKGGPCQF